eukprot:tig00020912_g15793.t1
MSDDEFDMGGRPQRQGQGDDDEFDFDEYKGGSGGKGGGTVGKAVQNKPYDEAVELSDQDSEGDNGMGGAPPKMGSSAPGDKSAVQVQNRPFDEAYDVDSDGGSESGKQAGMKPKGRGNTPPQMLDNEDGDYNSDDDPGVPQPQQPPAQSKPGPGASQKMQMQQQAPQQSEASSSEEEDQEDPESPGAKAAGGYNAAEYASLQVSAEIKDLFQYIGRYKPHSIDLETRLKPFIPDYIPAVGDIDAFIKVPRPDGKTDGLGLSVLDEPAAAQSDPTVVDLQLRAVSKQSNIQPMVVRSIDNAEKNPKAVNNWITSISDLHKSKPAPTVNYSKAMPDIEQLMQVFPDEFERLLQTTKLPSGDLDVDLKQYVRIICAILDIPVYQNVVESLHLLFSLYSDFKDNAHFGGAAQGLVPGGPAPQMGSPMGNPMGNVMGMGGGDVLTLD